MCAHSLLSRVLFSNIRLRKSKPKQGHYAKESVEVAKGQPHGSSGDNKFHGNTRELEVL